MGFIIYGAGERGRQLVLLLMHTGMQIDLIVDKNPILWGTKIGEFIINRPEEIKLKRDSYLCITPVFQQDRIREYIQELTGGKICEVTFNQLIQQVYSTISFEENLLLKNEKNDMSIVFECLDGFVLGGVQEWTKDICNKFLQEGMDNIKILSIQTKDIIDESLKKYMLWENLNIHDRFDVENIRKMICGIMGQLPCILVTSTPYILFAAKIVKQAYPEKLRVIAGIRNATENTFQEYIDFKDIIDDYVCVSSDITREMINRGIDDAHVHTMICPVKCPETLKREYTIDVNKPMKLGYAGRITVSQKRMDLLVKLIELLESKKVNYCFELAGDGDYLKNICEFIESKGIQNKVQCVGVLDKKQIGEFWRSKDICLNIADFEGRSRSIAEAMANGAVPIVTETSGVNDDIISGVNGYIVQVGDYEGMVDRILELEKSRCDLMDMGNAAYRELKEKCSMENHFQFWKRLIQYEVER